MANILLLGSGTQAYAIIKPLHKAGHRLFLLLGEKGNYADASKYVYKNFYSDFSLSSSDYIILVKRIIAEENIDIIIPTGDLTADFMSKNQQEFRGITHFKTPLYENFLRGYDKNKLMALCREKGYPHPLTIDLSKVDYKQDASVLSFQYPGLLKPNCTTGGRGMVLIQSHENLLRIYPEIHAQYGDCHLQRFIKAGGRQVKIQLYVDENGKLLQHSVLHKVRWYPVKGGASCCAVSIEEETMVQICHQILKDIHWIGFADFDTIEDPDSHELLIMEINPRLPACIGAAVHAGMDWGNVLVNHALGLPQKTYDYKKGITLRHLGFDVLWFMHSSERFHTHPSWFKFFSKNVYYQDFDFFDQKPFWVGTYHNIKKLFDPSFKKAKSGTSKI